MKTEIGDTAVIVPENQATQTTEVFAEVSLFGAEMAGSDENGDCSCFSCDGDPCVK
jgi:hypothetical protein